MIACMPPPWRGKTAYDTHIALIQLGALIRVRHGLDPEQPTRDGALFACAALCYRPIYLGADR